MRFSWIFLMGILSSGAASPQQAGFSGPVEGFTFDAPTATLRAIVGFPGAATFGPALLSGLEFASPAPQRNYAIAFQNGNAALVTGLDAASVSSVPLAGLANLPDGVAWTADGSFAVLYSRAGGWIQTVSGLPANPVVGASISLAPLGGPLAAVAVDSKQQQVAVAIGGGAAGVYLVAGTGNFTPLLQTGNPVALSFSTDGTQLFAVDAAGMQIAAVNLATFAFQMIPIKGVSDPFAVAQAAGQNVYVASRGDRTLQEYDLASGVLITQIPLSFAPTGIQQLGVNSFLLAARVRAADPLWLITASSQPAVYFVPAIPQTIGRPRTEQNASATSSPGTDIHGVGTRVRR